MKKLLFQEEQRFTQWWLWLIIISSFLFPMINIGSKFARSEDTASLIYVFFIIAAIGFVVLWIFGKLKLVVEITTKGLKYKFLPFLYKWKTIDPADIKRFEVRTYKPIREYGGWGMKGMNPRNKAYNAYGNIGLQLYLKDGTRILLGTQKKQAIEYAMKKLVAGENRFVPDNNYKQEESVKVGKKAKKILIILALEIVLAILILGVIQIFK